MDITINDKQYSIKVKAEEITLGDYLDCLDILSTPEYPILLNSKGNEYKSKDALPIEDRTEEFIMELYRRMIKRLSNIPMKYTKEETIIEFIIDKLNIAFAAIKELRDSLESNDDTIDEVFNYNDKQLKCEHVSKWVFNKWVTTEIWLSNGEQGDITNDKGEKEHGVITKGDRFILPILFGDYEDVYSTFDYFNKELSVMDTLPIYIKGSKMIQKVREMHPMIYDPPIGGGDDGSSPNMSNHSKIFGWADTMRSLADKQVFGTYLQLEEAPLMKVLQYLNTSVSYDRAESEDTKLRYK